MLAESSQYCRFHERFFQPLGLVYMLVCPVFMPARVDAAQLDEAPHVKCEIFHPDLRAGLHHAYRVHQRAAHVVGLRAEDMFDPDPHGRFDPIAALGLFGERLAPFPLAVNVAGQLPVAQLRPHLLGPIG